MLMSTRTEKRIWFALAVPAVAWSVQEIASAVVAHAACAEHAAGVGRAVLVGISVVALGLSLAAVAVGYGRFRALGADGAEMQTDRREREQMMALASVLVGVVLTVGVVWTALPTVLVSSVCGSKR